MGQWNNRWYPKRRNYRHDDRGREAPKYPAESSESSVPEWEKKFCYKVGSVPWRKVLDTKGFASCYPGVMNWDDSEAKDTFHTAKRRFWVLMNGHPAPAVDVPLPDPNSYIDEIDWNTCIDTELYVGIDSALLAANGAAEGVTEVGGNGVVDISALHQNSKWPEPDDVWDDGGCWDNCGDGGWSKANKWESNPVNDITDDHKCAKSGDNGWESTPVKTNVPVKKIVWGNSNDTSSGWKQPVPSFMTRNLHGFVHPRDGNRQGRGEESSYKGWTESGNNSCERTCQQNKFNHEKAWGYGSTQHNGASAARERSKHRDNSQPETSLVNYQHKQTESYHRSNGNWNTGNRGDRKRVSPNNYAPRSKSRTFQRADSQRHEPWRNDQSMQHTCSTFRVQT